MSGEWLEAVGDAPGALRRMRQVALIAQRQARKAGSALPFGEAFKAEDLKGVVGTRMLRRGMAAACVSGNVPSSVGMINGGWTRLSTMNKYANDATPLGHTTGGTNLADVCLHGKMAGEASSVTALQATVERLVRERAEAEEEMLM